MSVAFMLNGTSVEGRSDETLLQTARRHGIEIPHLCYKDGMRADGNCRACMVEIAGERVLAPSCCRYPQKGMQVQSDSPRALHSQKLVLELLQSDMPPIDYKPDSELDFWSSKLQVRAPRFEPRRSPGPDLSHP